MKFKVINVYVTGNTNTGENQVSRQDMLAWFQDCLHLDITDVTHLGKGFHYCQMINLLFPSVNAVPLKNVKFGAKSEHEYTENWKKLQGGFKKLDVDKVIPIERLIKLKMMDNMEFAQWFKKFFDANAGLDDTFGHYDAANERLRAGAAVPASTIGKAVTAPRRPAGGAGVARTQQPGAKTTSTVTPPKQASNLVQKKTNMQNGSGEGSSGNTCIAARRQPPPMQVQPPGRQPRSTGDAPATETAAVDHELIDSLKAKLEDANSQIDNSAAIIEGLERERDFYFSKLRDIEILAEEHEESGQLPDENVLKRIRDILYATEDGFIAPDVEDEDQADDLGYQDQDAEVGAGDDDETY